MKSMEWKTYRTRFLIQAKQLSSSLSFTDHLGRQHCGRKGDYLVESFDGVLSIAPRQIFEDIYVAMGLAPDPSDTQPHKHDIAAAADFRFEPLRVERIKTNFRDKEVVARGPGGNASHTQVATTGSRLRFAVELDVRPQRFELAGPESRTEGLRSRGQAQGSKVQALRSKL